MTKYTDILMGEQLFKKVESGIGKVSGIVKKTLGPGGQPIIIYRHGNTPYGSPLKPLVTKDGVTVAKSIKELSDPHENNAAQVVIGVAEKTNEEAGDGTTTAMVLAEAIFKQSLKYIYSGKVSQALYNEIQEAGNKVCNELDKMAIPIKTKNDIVNVATISANNDNNIGNVIYEAINEVGEDGVITLEEGQSRDTFVKIVEGFRIDRGILHPDFINNQATGECILTDCAVLVYNGDLENPEQIAPFIQKVVDIDNETGEIKNLEQNFFIIANNVSATILNFLGINRRKLNLKCAIIKGPDTTTVRTQMMEDIATLLGATLLGDGRKDIKLINHERGENNEIVKSDLGYADKIVSGRFDTIIYGGRGDEDRVMKRIDDLKELRKNAFSPYDLDQINKRIGYLSNGIAVISCGGSTDVEIKEKKDRIEDALNSTRAAIQNGIVIGGGAALLKAKSILSTSQTLTDGENIIKEALEEPIRMIVCNVGEKPDVIIDKVHNSDKNIGYDAKDKCIVDLIECGIIDPVKVVKSALTNSISIAGLLTTCGGSLVDVDK